MKKLAISVLIVGIAFLGSLAATQTPSRIAARVNGEEITMEELERAANTTGIIFYIYQRYPRFAQLLMGSPEGKALIKAYRREVLEDIIRWRIVLQEAKRLGIEISQEKLRERTDETIQEILSRNKLTQEDLQRILAQRGETLEGFRARIADQVREQMLVEAVKEEVTKGASVSEEEAQAYYRDHQDLFSEGGKVKPFGEVKDKIIADLLERKKNAIWRDWLREVREKAEVEVKI